MSDTTQNATISPVSQASNAIGSLLSSALTALKDAEASWRGIIGLTLILLFLLAYQGKILAPAQTVQTDNADVLKSVASVRDDIAGLMAMIVESRGEIGRQIEGLKPVAPAAVDVPVAPVARAKPLKKAAVQ